MEYTSVDYIRKKTVWEERIKLRNENSNLTVKLNT